MWRSGELVNIDRPREPCHTSRKLGPCLDLGPQAFFVSLDWFPPTGTRRFRDTWPVKVSEFFRMFCPGEVALEELEAHYASHHFAELVQLVELREEVAQLREEVRHLRGDARMRGGDRPRASASNHGYDDCFEIDSDRGGALFRLPEFSASDPERASSVPEFSATDSDF